jgi:hypothetical protein
MFIHIMEVDLFIIFFGQAGASFVSYRHTSFKKNHSEQNNFVHNYQVWGHTSFLVLKDIWLYMSYFISIHMKKKCFIPISNLFD